MAAPAFQSAATLATGTGTSLAGNAPSGVVSGDLLIANVNVPYANPTLSGSTGWVEIYNTPHFFDGKRTATFRRVADGGANDTFTATFGSSVDAQIGVIRISGQHATTPINATATSGDLYNGDPLSSVAVTTTVDDCLILAFCGCGVDKTGETAAVSAGTLRYSAVDPPFLVATQAVGTAGSHGALDFSLNGGAILQRSEIHTIAIAPAAGGSTIPIFHRHYRLMKNR